MLSSRGLLAPGVVAAVVVLALRAVEPPRDERRTDGTTCTVLRHLLCYLDVIFATTPKDEKMFWGHTGFFWLFLAFFGRDEVFFVRDARRACRGATCRTACWDFRVPSHAMVGVVVGV